MKNYSIVSLLTALLLFSTGAIAQEGGSMRVSDTLFVHVAMVSLNLKYQKLSYGKSTLQQIGTIPVGSSLGKLDDVAIASVTFPLAL